MRKTIEISLPNFSWKAVFKWPLLGAALLFCGAYWAFAIRPYLHIEGASLVAPTMEISSDQVGRLLYAPHEEGSFVKKGEALFSLSGAEEKARMIQTQKTIEMLERSLAAHLSGIEKAMQDYLSARIDFPDTELSVAPLAALQEHQNSADECKYKIEEAREKLADHQVFIDQKSFLAPFSGIITKREKREGEVVQFGDRIYSFCDPSRLWVEVVVPEKKISKVALHQKASIRLLSDSSKLTGAVSWISPIALANGEGVLVRIALDPSDKALSLPNFSADVDIRIH